MFKEFKKNMVATIILYVVIGVILILWPETTAKIVNYIIAFATACGGLVQVFMYIKKDVVHGAKGFDFTVGVVLLAIAAFLFFNPTFIMGIFPMLLGFIIFVSGVVKLQNAIDVARIGYEKWWIMMLMSFVAIGTGILILVDPFSTAKVLTRIIGVGFVYSALSDLIATFFMHGRVKEFENKLNESKVAVVIEEDDIR